MIKTIIVTKSKKSANFLSVQERWFVSCIDTNHGSCHDFEDAQASLTSAGGTIVELTVFFKLCLTIYCTNVQFIYCNLHCTKHDTMSFINLNRLRVKYYFIQFNPFSLRLGLYHYKINVMQSSKSLMYVISKSFFLEIMQSKQEGWLGFCRLCPETKIVDKLRVPVWVGLLRQNSIGLQERFGKQAIDETLILG